MKRKRQNLLAVTGKETFFEATQICLAALTLANEGSRDTQLHAVESVFALDPVKAVNALWIICSSLLSGFDTDEDRAIALRLVAQVVARNEEIFNVHLR